MVNNEAESAVLEPGVGGFTLSFAKPGDWEQSVKWLFSESLHKVDNVFHSLIGLN